MTYKLFLIFRLDTLETAGSGGLTIELDQCRRREKSLQYELDQARHAITNLKVYLDPC